ncbi:hypothetical protein ACN42_g203 [Penicillium freii]|uniref:Uncharacterized protein n=1 Tax=Penicillium freii TaxID=48697 RepID=A0A117NT06_PENFR|nr:hypothetical protein ACN42_g203 [Penicillium freii]
MHKSNHAFKHKCPLSRISRIRGEKEKREMSKMDFQVEITCRAPHREREQGKLDLTEITRDLPVHCSDLICIAASKCALEFISCASLKPSPSLRSTSAPCDTRPCTISA